MASVRLFNKGADGYASDRGFWVRDILSQSWPQARSGTTTGPDGSLLPTTRLLEEVGVVVPNFELVPQDTTLSHWTGGSTDPELPNGDWEDSSAQFPHRSAFLYQIFPNPDHNYWLDGDFDLPEDPWFAFSLGKEGIDYRSDAAVEPYINVVWGNDTWSIKFRSSGPPQLFKADGGDWHWRTDLRSAPRVSWSMWGGEDRYDVVTCIVLHVRDSIMISFDQGDTWDAWTEPAGASAEQGIARVEGTGQSMQWWWHQVRPLVPGIEAADPHSSFESMLHPIFEDRIIAPTYVVDEDYHKFLRENTEVDVTNVSTAEDNTSAYEVEFTCSEIDMVGSPFTVYGFPAIAGVDFYWPIVLVPPAPAGYVDLTWTPGVVGLSVEQPDDLTANSAVVRSLLRPDTTFVGEYRWRYVEIDIGFRYTDNSYVLWPVFAGYVEETETRQDPSWWHGHHLNMRLVDATWRFKSSEVDEGFQPQDGATANAAILYCANKCGHPSSRVDLVANTVTLTDGGAADNPLWHWAGDNAQLRLGMSMWDVMAMIADFAGVELFVGGDGVLYSRPRNIVLPAVHTFDGSDAANLDDAIQEVEYSASVRDQGTAAIVRGEDLLGRGVAAYAIDFARERIPATTPFVSWRMTRRIDGREFVELPECVRVANIQYAQMHESSYTLGFETHGNPEVDRREQAQILNVAVGTVVNDRFQVNQVSHSLAPELIDCKSEFVARQTA
jgi:hypothetical protein